MARTHAAAPGAHWETLGPGVWRTRLPGWDETVGAVAGARGVLLVDAGPSLRAGARLRREVREATGLPVRHVALTHPHFDHVLGAGALPGATVYGAAGLAGALRGPARDRLRDDAVAHGLDAAQAAAAAAALPAPDREVSGRMTLDLGGGRTVLLAAAGPGHTASDLAVAVRCGRVDGGPERTVVFCGDLVEESGEPQAGEDAHPALWPAALDRLLALGGPHARYVPGHGAVVDAAFVRAQRDALAARFGVARGG